MSSVFRMGTTMCRNAVTSTASNSPAVIRDMIVSAHSVHVHVELDLPVLSIDICLLVIDIIPPNQRVMPRHSHVPSLPAPHLMAQTQRNRNSPRYHLFITLENPRKLTTPHTALPETTAYLAAPIQPRSERWWCSPGPLLVCCPSGLADRHASRTPCPLVRGRPLPWLGVPLGSGREGGS
jgi:hypothetical protein